MNEPCWNNPDPVRAREEIDEADCLLARGDRTGAAAAFARAARLDPFDAETPLLEAMLCFEDGRLSRAAELALEASRIRPFNPPALNLLGVVCLDAGHAGTARGILRRLVAAAPGFRGAKRNLRQARRAPAGHEPVSDFPIGDVRTLLGSDVHRLSVCVLADDPGADLAATLASVERVATEIAILDATPDGLERRVCSPGTAVHRVPRTADLAARRNAAIRRARSDWILLLESGETLHTDDPAALDACLRRRRSLYHEVEIRAREGGARCREPRLFRNAVGLRYVGSVHPSARPSLRELAASWQLGKTRPSIVIETAHPLRYGKRDRSSRELLQGLTREDLRREPGHGYLLLQRARVLLETDQPVPALEALVSLRNAETPAHYEAEELATLEALCLLRLERHAAARERIGAYHDANPATRNTLFLDGFASRACHEDAAAARAFARCLDDDDKAYLLPPLAELGTTGWPNLLGATLLDLGRFDEAGDAFDLVLRRDPVNVEARVGCLALRLARGEIEALLQDLDRWVDEQGERTQVWSYGAVLLGKLPDLAPVAVEWMDEACRRFPDDDDLRRQQVEAHLRRGSADVALELLGRLPGKAAAELAARFAASLVVGTELPQIPSEAREAVEREVLGWLRIWMACASYSALDRALLEMERASTRLPNLPALTAGWLVEIGQEDAAARIRQERTAGGASAHL